MHYHLDEKIEIIIDTKAVTVIDHLAQRVAVTQNPPGDMCNAVIVFDTLCLIRPEFSLRIPMEYDLHPMLEMYLLHAGIKLDGSETMFTVRDRSIMPDNTHYPRAYLQYLPERVTP